MKELGKIKGKKIIKERYENMDRNLFNNFREIRANKIEKRDIQEYCNQIINNALICKEMVEEDCKEIDEYISSTNSKKLMEKINDLLKETKIYHDSAYCEHNFDEYKFINKQEKEKYVFYKYGGYAQFSFEDTYDVYEIIYQRKCIKCGYIMEKINEINKYDYNRSREKYEKNC